MPDSLNSQAVRAVKWASFAELLPKLAAPISLIILARLLSPADFGIVAAATVVVSFSQLFWDAGLTKALIHYQGDIFPVAQVVFWTNLVIAFAIVAVIYPAAPWIAEHIFHDAKVTTVLRVMSLAILIQALCAVPQALIQRELDFRLIFWTSIPNTVTPLMVSIPLAVAGASYWALIVSNLTAAAAQTVLLYRNSNWRPRLRFDKNLAIRLASYGGWVSGSAILGWLFKWLDTLLIGSFFGTSTLGAFIMAKSLVSAISLTLFIPLSNVLFPTLSKLQSNTARLRKTFLTVSKFTGLVAIAVVTPVALLSDEIVQVLFGAKWASSAIFIMYLALCEGLSWTVSLNSVAYRAIGRPDAEFKVMSISMAIRAAFYAISIPFGINALLASRLGSVVLGVMNHTWFAGRLLNTGFSAYYANNAKALLAAVCAALTYLAIFDPILESLPAIIRLVAGGSAMAFVLLLMLLVLEGEFLMRVLSRLFTSERIGQE